MGSQPTPPQVALVDLPTFPRGTLSPSLPTVAGCLDPYASVRIFDQNFESREQIQAALRDWSPAVVGFKVSAQNFGHAQSWAVWVQETLGAKVLWGGELPTLLPERCQEHADTVVLGRLEDVAEEFGRDLLGGALTPRYQGQKPGPFVVPRYGGVSLDRYHRFMGRPVETSRGCPYHCNFCMVHTMQPTAVFKPEAMLREELRRHGRTFINVVDYNLGQDRDHLLRTATALGESPALGWMGEMCVENLDDEEVLKTLAKSRCRIVYCGLDAVDSEALRFVGKTQNHTEDYTRIIRNAQAHGIEVASGFILGVGHTDTQTIERAIDFFEGVGIAYVKLTFLTYNPGTAVHTGMERHGAYRTSAVEQFDGHHLTYVPEGVEPQEMLDGLRTMVERLYSWESLWKRTTHLVESPRRRLETVLFARCFGDSYRHWLRHEVANTGGLLGSLAEPYDRPGALQDAEALLDSLRRGGPVPSAERLAADYGAEAVCGSL